MKNKNVFYSVIFEGILIFALIILSILFGFGIVQSIALLQIIPGSIIPICLIAMSIQILIKKGKLNIFDWVSISVYYLTTIALVCAYLASIPENSLRDVLTSIASATIGGLLTLMGVGITIKYAKIEKEEDEIKKCKPRVFPISDATWKALDKQNKCQVVCNQWKSQLTKAKDKEKAYCVYVFFLATSDLSMCVYDGIIIDDKELWFDFGVVLQRNKDYALFHDIRFKSEEKPSSVYLLLTDMLDNTYKAKMSFELEKDGKDTIIKITSILNTEMYIKDNKIR